MRRPAEESTAEDPLVSVIVPVYDVAPLVEACVRSILTQSHDRLDIVLVDDGSTDGSREICERIAAEDARVRVLTKSNGGLSDARNHGIRHARGELITCVDGDDLIALHHVRALVRPLTERAADLSCIGFVRVPEGFVPSDGGEPSVDYRIRDRESALEHLFLQDGVTTSAWGKMYRRSAFEGIEYPVGAIHEDLPVTYRLFWRARSVAFVDGVGYFYVQREASITGRADHRRRIEAVAFAEEAVTFCEYEAPALVPAARVRVFMECVYLLSQVPQASEVGRVDPAVPATIRRYRRGVITHRRAAALHRGIAAVSYAGPLAVWAFMRMLSRSSALRSRLRGRR